jgi:hypothetical protein
MSLLKSDDFIADVEGQYEWYAINAGTCGSFRPASFARLAVFRRVPPF